MAWRPGDEQPPSALLIHSPYDLEARYSSKRETLWVGYKVQLTETCDADHPDLITQVLTTPALFRMSATNSVRVGEECSWEAYHQ